MTSLRALDARFSDTLPTFADFGRVDAVNAFVEVTVTSSTNASPERRSAAEALTAAPAVETNASDATSAKQAASGRNEVFMARQ